MSFFVYIHTCPNGKKYIGVTTQKKPEDRWRDGERYQHNKHFTSAINKYGWDNIEHEYFKTESKELMFYWEKILIYYHNTLDREFGYNKTGGGEGPNGLKHTEETKKKISESLKGRPCPTKGKNLSDEHKKKLSKAGKGRKVPEETKRKMS